MTSLTLLLYGSLVALLAGAWLVRRRSDRAGGGGGGGTLKPRETARLTEAFDALGPARVRRGLAADQDAESGSFVLAALADEMGGRTGRYAWRYARWRLGDLMGHAPWIADEIARIWDRRQPAFRTLAEQWLGRQRPYEAGFMKVSAPNEEGDTTFSRAALGLALSDR
jgi:hypothetical protein